MISDLTPADAVRRLIADDPVFIWPHDRATHLLPGVQEAYRQMMTEAVQAIPPAPRPTGQRRVVLCGGTTPVADYQMLNWINCTALRHYGWKGAIEVWHAKGQERLDPGRFAQFGVRIVDAEYRRTRFPSRTFGGWERKSFAILAAGSDRLAKVDDEVLFLDADNLVVSDVTTWFDDNPAGTLVWYNYHAEAWLAVLPYRELGLPAKMGKPFTGGQYIFRKSDPTSWRILNLWRWFDNHSDFYYRNAWKTGNVWGDQDTLRMAFLALGVTPHTYAPFSWGRGKTMLTHAPGFSTAKKRRYQGQPFYATVHRFQDKGFETFDPAIPEEQFFHGLAREYRRRYHGTTPEKTGSA